MSEISTGCGSRSLKRIYNEEEPESDATNQWPIQPIPPITPKGAWVVWEKYLGFILTSQPTVSLIRKDNHGRHCPR
jgi:hypothetical protein